MSYISTGLISSFGGGRIQDLLVSQCTWSIVSLQGKLALKFLDTSIFLVTLISIPCHTYNTTNLSFFL